MSMIDGLRNVLGINQDPEADSYVDDNSDVAAEYGIRNIPTVLFFKNGEIVDKQVGAVAKPVFVEKVKNLL